MNQSVFTPSPAGGDLAQRVAKTLGVGPSTLSPVDFDDLYVSEQVLGVLDRLAEAALKAAETPAEGPALSAYWREDSPELVICASLGPSVHLVRVPKAHWALKPAVVH